MKRNDVFKEIQEVAAFLVNKGWAERNAGNFSHRLDAEVINTLFKVIPEFRHRICLEIDLEQHNIKGNIDPILISVADCKFRDIVNDPLSHCGIVLYEDNKLIFLSCQDNIMPTSELPSHLSIHQFLSANNPTKSSVLHTHPTYLLALSHKFYGYSKEKLNGLLESIMPEVGYYIPKQAGFVDYHTPGSNELAQATIQELTNHDVIVWKKHGCLAVAETFWGVVDMMDMLDKAAHVALLAGLE